MVSRYYRDSVVGLYDPAKTNASFFKASSVGSALVDNVNALNAAKAQKARLTGETKLKSVQHMETDLSMDLKSSPSALYRSPRTALPVELGCGRDRREAGLRGARGEYAPFSGGVELDDVDRDGPDAPLSLPPADVDRAFCR